MPETLRVCALSPALMNIYADRGNLLLLQRRCEWRGIGFELSASELREPLDPDAAVGAHHGLAWRGRLFSSCRLFSRRWFFSSCRLFSRRRLFDSCRRFCGNRCRLFGSLAAATGSQHHRPDDDQHEQGPQ